MLCGLIFLVFCGTFGYLVVRNMIGEKPPCPLCKRNDAVIYLCGQYNCTKCKHMFVGLVES